MPDALARFAGELAALAAACLWAVATELYARLGLRIPPLELNLVKNVLAAAMIAVFLLAGGRILAAVPREALGLLLISGAVGIGLGDTAYFASLGHLGSRRALLLGVLAPPLAALFALATLREVLPSGAWLGIVAAVAGVTWVITEREPADGGRARVARGAAFGLLAAAGQAAGAVLSHAALVRTDVGLFQSALLRLLAGIAGLLLTLGLRRRRILAWWPAAGRLRLTGVLVVVTFLGTALCLVLQQAALRLSSAGVAQTLLSTSPLFILPIAAGLGERVSPRAVLGATIALVGVALLFYYKA